MKILAKSLVKACVHLLGHQVSRFLSQGGSRQTGKAGENNR